MSPLPAKAKTIMKIRRWYDKEPDCTKLVDQIHAIRQSEVLDFVSKTLFHFSERMHQAILKRQGGGLVSLGLPALQGIYVAKREKRRWYDRDPMLQKAVSSLYTLPKEGLTAVSFQLIEPVNLIALYSFVCDQVGQDPEVQDMVNILVTGLQHGREEAEELLSKIVGKDLYDAFSQEFQ